MMGFEKLTQEVMSIGKKEVQFFRMHLGNKASVRLLYRGSRDGFYPRTSHEEIASKGPTLHLIKSEFNRVLGGYRFISYPGNRSSQADPKAFIFSLTDQRRLSQIQQNKFALQND